LFNEKFVSKTNKDHWNEVLLKYMPEGIHDIQSDINEDGPGDRLVLDHVGGNVSDFKSPGKHN